MPINDSFSVVLVKKAHKELLHLPQHIRARIVVRIQTLQTKPFPADVKKLKGLSDVYRIREQDWRILYSVDMKTKIITIFRIAHRKEVYKP